MSDWRVWLGLAALFFSVRVAAERPEAPSFRLDGAARPERYEVHLAVDPQDAEFSGHIRIEMRFERATPILWLNATGLSIEAAEIEQAGRTTAVKVVAGNEDFVGFESAGEPFAPGHAVARVRYRGKFEAVGTRGLFRQRDAGDWYVLSQFEALSARRAFPCFDEPGIKTPWRLTIDAPPGNIVASNTPLEREGEVPGSTWRRHAFAPTPPLPSYLVALAVGPFDVVDGGRAGVRGTPLRYLAPRGRGAQMRYAREVTPRLLELMESYFGIPYPFDKLDSVVIPNLVSFGAMENVGLITYGARYIMALPHEEDEAFRRRYASLAAHEIAHMWFGNLVTLAWWDDIWLNEAFASWIGEKIAHRFRPEWDDGVRRAYTRSRAIASDRLASTRVIANPVRTRADLSGAFDSITYDKGSEVLSMFEEAFGHERFRDGVRLFLDRHKWGTATSSDFFGALAQASGQGEGAMRAFASFIRQPGVPLIDARLRCGAGEAALELSQSRLRPLGSKAPDQRWSTPICVRYADGGKDGSQCGEVAGDSTRMAIEGAAHCPGWIVGNRDGAGHYVMRYDEALARRIRARIAEIPRREALTAANDALLLWESGLLPAQAVLRWVQAALAHPAAPVKETGARMLGKLQHAALREPDARRRAELHGRALLPLARELGWVERDGEEHETRQLRNVVMGVAAQGPAGAALRAAARAEARRWVADRASVGATVLPAVLDTAARFADLSTYGLLETAMLAPATSDGERSLLLRALGTVRDPVLRERAYRLALERLDGARSFALVNFALGDDANRAEAFAFLRGHFEALVARMPEHSAARLMIPLGSLCTPRDRDAFAGFFRERAGRFLGGAFHYRQALETIDICVARRAQDLRATDSTKPRLRASSPSRADSSPPPMSSIVSLP